MHKTMIATGILVLAAVSAPAAAQAQVRSYESCWTLAYQRGFGMTGTAESETLGYRHKFIADCMAGRLK